MGGYNNQGENDSSSEEGEAGADSDEDRAQIEEAIMKNAGLESLFSEKVNIGEAPSYKGLQPLPKDISIPQYGQIIVQTRNSGQQQQNLG